MYVFKVFITYILLTEVFNVNRFIKLLQGFVFFFRFLEISRGGAGLSRNRCKWPMGRGGKMRLQGVGDAVDTI